MVWGLKKKTTKNTGAQLSLAPPPAPATGRHLRNLPRAAVWADNALSALEAKKKTGIARGEKREGGKMKHEKKNSNRRMQPAGARGPVGGPHA